VTTQIRHGLTNLPFHSPVTHGFTEFDLEIQDGKVTKAKPILGSMHRGAEKLFESRDYRQILSLANRHEWLGSFAGELGVSQLIEDALGIEVPVAAQWLRTYLIEYTRVTSHLAFLAGFPWVDKTIDQLLRENRELWINHIANYTGNRMHVMVSRIGGLSHAPTQSWLNQTSQLVAKTQSLLSELDEQIQNELDKFRDVGKLSNTEAIEYAVSGPVARASGYQIDLRPTARGLKYGELSPAIHSINTGDVSGRINQLVNEVMQSLNWLIELDPKCGEQLDQELDVLLPKVLRVPEGVYQHDLETPLGVASWLLVSHNDKMPHRLKLRPASLHTLLATEKVLVGVDLEMLDAVIASMPFISGDVDR
jgi:NADH-quinone oxidoreductase subunit D